MVQNNPVRCCSAQQGKQTRPQCELQDRSRGCLFCFWLIIEIGESTGVISLFDAGSLFSTRAMNGECQLHATEPDGIAAVQAALINLL